MAMSSSSARRQRSADSGRTGRAVAEHWPKASRRRRSAVSASWLRRSLLKFASRDLGARARRLLRLTPPRTPRLLGLFLSLSLFLLDFFLLMRSAASRQFLTPWRCLEPKWQRPPRLEKHKKGLKSSATAARPSGKDRRVQIQLYLSKSICETKGSLCRKSSNVLPQQQCGHAFIRRAGAANRDT